MNAKNKKIIGIAGIVSALFLFLKGSKSNKPTNDTGTTTDTFPPPPPPSTTSTGNNAGTRTQNVIKSATQVLNNSIQLDYTIKLRTKSERWKNIIIDLYAIAKNNQSFRKNEYKNLKLFSTGNNVNVRIGASTIAKIERTLQNGNFAGMTTGYFAYSNGYVFAEIYGVVADISKTYWIAIINTNSDGVVKLPDFNFKLS